MHTAQSLARDRRIPNPEIDVLSPVFNAAAAARRVQAHASEEIADVLLHQEVLAGVGNVFKSEICFVTGINPFCKVAALSEEQVLGAIAAAQKLVAANVLENSGDTIVTMEAANAAPRTSPIPAPACGFTGETASHAAAAASRSGAASRAQMYA